MMFRLGGNLNRGRRRKPIAAFAAALVFFAQLLAVSHYHQTDSVRRFGAQAQVLTDDGLCALCTLAFHLPLNPAALPTIERPQIDLFTTEAFVPRFLQLRPYSLSRTRAPPSSVA
jgi:hypothetical protein